MEQQKTSEFVVPPEDHMKLCHHVVRRMIRGTLYTRCVLSARYYDEYISVAAEALVEAAKAYDPEKYNTKFTTFAVKCIVNKLILFQMQFVTKKSVRCVTSFSDFSTILSFEDREDTTGQAPEFPITVAELALELPERYREVIRGLMEGKNLSDIAREKNLTRQRIHQMYSKAIETMRARAKALYPSEFKK